MSDKEFLQWIYNRMIYVHGEKHNTDYMKRFYKIVHDKEKTPKNKDYNPVRSYL